jgi:hypothetical protein
MRFIPHKLHRAALSAALAGLLLNARPVSLCAQAAAQQTQQNELAPESELAEVPLPEDSRTWSRR